MDPITYWVFFHGKLLFATANLISKLFVFAVLGSLWSGTTSIIGNASELQHLKPARTAGIIFASVGLLACIIAVFWWVCVAKDKYEKKNIDLWWGGCTTQFIDIPNLILLLYIVFETNHLSLLSFLSLIFDLITWVMKLYGVYHVFEDAETSLFIAWMDVRIIALMFVIMCPFYFVDLIGYALALNICLFVFGCFYWVSKCCD
eukprot:321923_1